MKAVIALLALVGVASAGISNLGKCQEAKAKALAIDIDYDEFCKTNNGYWEYKYATEYPNYADAKKIYTEITPDACTYGDYHTIIYKVTATGKEVLSDNYKTYKGDGYVFAKNPKNGNEIKYYILDYKPGKWIYFYACSDNGAETEKDTRAVLAQEDLCDDDLEEIKAKDQVWKGKLKEY